jgi:hypothetical protein
MANEGLNLPFKWNLPYIPHNNYNTLKIHQGIRF